MKIRNLNKKIIVSITGSTEKEWKDKLEEIKKLKVKRFAVFLSQYGPSQRQKIYKELLKIKTKKIKIPLIHLRDDMNSEEVGFLVKNFKPKYLTIHEDHFKFLDKWKEWKDKLLLEMNYNDQVPKEVAVEKIKGFCIDLSHFKASQKRQTKDFDYIISKKKSRKYFKANHLNGYNKQKEKDIHKIQSLRNFDYLTSLPNFLFGKVIALETQNPIAQQIKFKEHIISLLS
ncbi:hypothetical protein GOV14_05100 [Candidatus Pacearchaeota archaeon]|nr:hypothetical protein [Candidatus Pacearchaeota archaeon]